MEEEQTPVNNSKSPMLLIGLGVIVLVAIGAFVLMNSQNKSASTTTQNTTESTMQNESTAPSAVEGESETNTSATGDESASVKEFTVHGGMFYFKADRLTVKKGDTVKIHFVNDEGTHDFVLDEFNVETPVINAGETADVEFVADKAGTFEYYCSVGNHRAMGMVGKLTVTE